MIRKGILLVVIILIGINSSTFTQSFRSGVFLHHSTGGTIWGPNGSNTSILQEMTAYNTANGYTGSDAVSMNEVWFPGSGIGNEWYDWHWIFDNLDPNNNIYPYLANNKIVVIKSCFPSSSIIGYGSPDDTSGAGVTYKTIYNYKWHWRSILRIMEQHPENFFVIWTNAPLVQEATNSSEALLAHQFTTWAKDTLAAGLDATYGAFPPNVYVFDFFHKLTNANHFMNPMYQIQSGDSHPNAAATQLVAPQFVNEIFNAAINYENISGGTSFQLTVPVQNGWNMVSIPGLHPTNQNVTTWWSEKDPAAGVYRFSGGYVPVTTTIPGHGYWMKHLSLNTYNTGDEWPAGGIIPVANTPISGTTGWNLIGGYETIVATSGIITTPAGLQTGSVFQYASGYTVATNLVPGYGYWIKLIGAGSINIPTSLAKGLAKTTEVNTSDWGKIIITDKSGKSYTLYTVKGEVNLNDFELPPAPPEGMFDVRFGSGRYAEELSAVNQTIELNSLEYPVRVRVENADIRLQDGTGNGLNERLKSGEEVTISNSAINKLMVSGDVIPATYSLDQNYPNPFNPSTSIKYAIGSRQFVTLKVYDVLGNEISTLVNEEKPAGIYEVEFNPASSVKNPASGIYFYQLKAGNFVQTRKMVVLK